MGNIAFLFDYFLDLLVLYLWPSVGLYAIIQNDITKNADKYEMKKVIFTAKVFGVFMLVLLIVFWEDAVKGFIQVIVTAPDLAKDYGASGLAFMHMLVIVIFYISVFLINENITSIYLFPKIRLIIIGLHVFTGVLLPVLLVAGIFDEPNLFMWKWLLLINYIFMILVILTSSLKVFIEEDGKSVGCNKIIIQNRLYKNTHEKFILKVDGKNSIIIKTEEDSICINNIGKKIITRVLEINTSFRNNRGAVVLEMD